MKFTFAASGLDSKDYQYIPEWYRSDYTIISKHKIGTEKGISLSIGNSSIQTGTAVKIQIEKTGEDKIVCVISIGFGATSGKVRRSKPLDKLTEVFSNGGTVIYRI